MTAPAPQGSVPPAQVQLGDAGPETVTGRGFEKLDPSPLADPYRKRWAVVIGINYAQPAGQPADPTRPSRLKNAVNDANAVFKILCDGYGYDENRTAFKLTEEKATRAEIDRHLLSVLCDPAKVSPSDSVLVYFAGHGKKRELQANSGKGKEEAVLVPWDGKLRDGQPTPDSVIGMLDLVKRLRDDCPARHKLLILDCCHAGSIFLGEVQAVETVRGTGWSRGVFLDPAFQGLASSRTTEPAEDALKGTDHSPFTYGLLQGLERLPRSQGPRLPIPASQAFSMIEWTWTHNRSGGEEQKPGCRWLTGDQGEFHFIPEPSSPLFAPKEMTDDDLIAATTLLPGSYGAWWFTESPWFIPALRVEIVQTALEKNSAEGAVRGNRREGFHKYLLQSALAEVYARQKELAGGVSKPDANWQLKDLRLRCVGKLLDPSIRKDPRRVYETLLGELNQALEKGVPLAGSDLHLRAVLSHRLGRPDALEAYDAALKKYRDEKSKRDHHPAKRFLLAPEEGLECLCLADKGEYLCARQENARAARAFQEALGSQVLLPAPFRVYALVRAADCWQTIGHSRETDDRLAHASAVAEAPQRLPGEAEPDPSVRAELLSYVAYRRAWAHVDQFNYSAAEACFGRSTQLLDEEGPSGAGKPGRATDRSGVWGARIMRLHNQHGLAITARYAGKFDLSAERYRALLRDVREQFAVLRREGGGEEEVLDVREQLAERLVNACERRAECFLYRADADVKEAQDDFAHAGRVCAYLTAATRASRRAQILYKLSLAYAVPSPFQDLELSARTHREAAELGARWAAETGVARPTTDDEVGDPDRILREVPAALIAFYQPGEVGHPGVGTPEVWGRGPSAPPRVNSPDRLGTLRKALLALRPDANRNLSRDELDVLLTGCKTLLDEGLKAAARDRYTLLADAELALSLTRVAIRAGGKDMQAYFRPYYDAAIRAMIAARPPQVKGLIDATWEATTGRAWVKPMQPAPILAAYVLDGRFVFFLDLPGGMSQVFVGGQAFELARVKRMVGHGAGGHGVVALPAELGDALVRLADNGVGGQQVTDSQGSKPSPTFAGIGGGMVLAHAPNSYRTDRLNVHWYDPLYGIGSEPPPTAPGATVSAYLSSGPLLEFPFALPEFTPLRREPRNR